VFLGSVVHGCKRAAALFVPNNLEAIVFRRVEVASPAQLPSGFPVVTGASELKAVLINGTILILLPLSFLDGDLLTKFALLFSSARNLGFFTILGLGELRFVLDFETVVGFDARISGVSTGASQIELAAEGRPHRALLLLDRRRLLLLGHGLARQHLGFLFGLFL
jgi:hypothetical protein